MSQKRARKQERRSKILREKAKCRNRRVNAQYDRIKKDKLKAYTLEQIEKNRLELEARKVAYEADRQRAFDELSAGFSSAWTVKSTLPVNWKSEGF